MPLNWLSCELCNTQVVGCSFTQLLTLHVDHVRMAKFSKISPVGLRAPGFDLGYPRSLGLRKIKSIHAVPPEERLRPLLGKFKYGAQSHMAKIFGTSALLANQITPAALEKYGQVKKQLQEYANKIRKEGDYWVVDSDRDPNFAPYEHDFFEFLKPFRSFAEWIKNRKKEGRSANVLDLFGSGFRLENVNEMDSQTGVRLLAGMNQPDKKKWVLPGDLFETATWHELNLHMRQNIISAFDLVTIRPVGVFYDICRDWELEKYLPHEKPTQLHIFYQLYFEIVRKAYSLLSSHDGHLMVQLPWLKPQTDYQNAWLANLEAAGIAVQAIRSADNYVRFVKLVKSPTSNGVMSLPVFED